MFRLFVIAVSGILTVTLTSCAPQDDQARATHEAGGTIPWNRPAGWEGPGVLGSQMSQMQGGGGGF